MVFTQELKNNINIHMKKKEKNFHNMNKKSEIHFTIQSCSSYSNTD